MLRTRYAPALLVTGALVAAACGAATHAHAPTVAANANGSTSTSGHGASTTGAPGTTASAGGPAAIFPLTGLPATNLLLLGRPALSIKVDNAPQAQPKVGLNAADIVTEEVVEGGLTRFFVTFQSQDANVVGPIRSARPVDADLLRQLGGGILVYSGAALGEIAPSKAHSNAMLLSQDAGNHGFYRDYHRPAPSNVFGSTQAFFAEGARVAGHPLPAAPPLFSYSTTAPTGFPIKTTSMVFSGLDSVSWNWDSASGLYTRMQNGVLDKLGDGSPITTNNIVTLSITLAHTGIIDQSGNEDPLDVIIGSGTCWVLRNGTVVQGTWNRASYAVPMQLVGPDGKVIALQPGRTWLELLPRTAPGQPHFS